MTTLPTLSEATGKAARRLSAVLVAHGPEAATTLPTRIKAAASDWSGLLVGGLIMAAAVLA